MKERILAYTGSGTTVTHSFGAFKSTGDQTGKNIDFGDTSKKFWTTNMSLKFNANDDFSENPSAGFARSEIRSIYATYVAQLRIS